MRDLFQNGHGIASLVALLRMRTQTMPQARAYTFVKDGLSEETVYSYADLDQAARAIAVALQQGPQALQRGDRALLLYPPGLEFMAAFMGCLYAGIVPIPAPPPDNARFKRTFPRLRSIMEDAGARLIVATASIAHNAQSVEAQDTRWLCSDEVDLALAGQWQDPGMGCDELAYLQYTSGSTSSPKGVMLSHRSVLRNLELSRVGWSYTADSVAVTWMPYFHDYGLVDGLLQPLYSGIPCYVLSPLLFVKRPQRWLEVIQRYGGTHTQAPNFAYELCLEKISAEQRDALDLSRLRVASNGAEPVRADTYERFVAFFGPCGFRPEAFCPSYGLAEATLLVSAKPATEPLRVAELDARALEHEHRYVPAMEGAPRRSVVSCGPPLGDLRLRIVDPGSRLCMAERSVGEIWVQDACVAQGYWGRPADSRAAFDARIADEDALGGFLRTGDLGFLSEGELYVTGRLKDLIIVDGVNHYPQDIEWTVQRSHADFRPEHCAAFAVEQGAQERLVVVAEVTRAQGDWAALTEAVRQAVAQAHEVELHALVLLRKGGIFKTSSGKIQRSQCRAAFLDGSLAVLSEWRKPAQVQPAQTARPAVPAGLERWLVERLARQLELPVQSIDPQATFASHGLNSRASVQLVGDLEQWLGRDDLSPTLLWEYPSVRALCVHLEGDAASALSGAPAPVAGEQSGAVAIIGMACRLPGADSPEALWNLLRQRGDAIGPLPEGRWQGSGMAVAEGQGPGCVRSLRAGFMDEVDRFDAGFFDIGAREAGIMDPQQRLLLELGWEAIESARLNAQAIQGSPTGVYIGISTDDYSAWQLASAEHISAYTGTAKALSIAANRLSYQFDFQGPSMAIDTACSSSLVAIHQACAALRRGECTLALAGGVNLLLAPQMGVALTQAGMLAPDGRCKTFDARADGYGRGEGAVVLVLKPLEQALRDGDPIAAVIRGSAVNQDGRSNGLTAPNGLAQQRVIRQALAAAGVAGHEIGYVEAHGTGTPLGDPIEVRSLRAVLGEGRPAGRRCALGSVKANIGHLEAAAGAAGLLKTVLCLQHGEIVGHPTLEQLNPLLELGDSLAVPTQSGPWPEGRRIAGVSAFGFGGTNAHLIVESAPAPQEQVADTDLAAPADEQLLCLSAQDEAGLRALAGRWIERLDRDDRDAWSDLCFSAQTTRAALPQRLCVCASDRASARAALADWLDGRPGAWQAGRAERQAAPRVGFLFTGQGAQYVGMGRALYQRHAGFRQDIDACAALLRAHAGLDLLALLHAEPGPDSEAALARTDHCQPALFALQYALARLWMGWGVQPQALLGHSVGELAAAVTAGVLTLADGVRLISARGRLMHQAPGDGAMASVMADEAQCRAALAGLEAQVVIAVHNGAQQQVLAGERAPLEQALARLAAAGVTTRPLNVSHAFHSPLMDDAARQLAAVCADIVHAPPQIPFYGNLDGAPMAPDAAYWPRHLREPVRFAQGLAAMHAAGIDSWIEIGPRATLLALARQQAGDDAALLLPSLRPQTPELRQLLESLGALQVRGQAIDWAGMHAGAPRRRLALPTYRFQGRRHWLPAVVPAAMPASAAAETGFPGRRTSSPLLSHHLFELRYDTAAMSWLSEHRVFGQVVVPGAAHVSLVLEAARALLGEGACTLRDVLFSQALVVAEPGGRQVQLALERDAGPDGRAFRLISQGDGESAWTEHASGHLAGRPDAAAVPALDALRARGGSSLGRDFYEAIWQAQIGLGPRFRWVDEVWRLDGEVLARLCAPAVPADGLRLPPGLIDSMLQVLVCAVDAGDSALVPFGLAAFHWLAPLGDGPLWSHVRLHPAQESGDEVFSDVSLYADDGRLVAQALGFRARRVSRSELIRARGNPLDKAVYALDWEPGLPQPVALQGRCLLLGGDAAQRDALAAALQERAPGLAALPLPADAGEAGAQPLDELATTQALLGAQPAFQHLVYLPPAGLAPAQASARLLHLAQALLALDRGDGAPQLLLLTREAQLQGGHAAHAALWGMARVLRLEHPALGCRCIDADGFDAPAWAQALLGDAEELALREGRTLLPRLRRQPLPAPAPVAIRGDGSYLISGGLGALGLRLADSLVRQGARHLLLLGRSAPSPEAAAQLAAWQAQGVAVHAPRLDIADPVALDTALRLPAMPLAAVFHLAGELDDGLLRQFDRQRLARVMRAKVDGALNLERATEHLALDFFVCYSSVAGVTGSMGQGGYAAANAALDALMAARRRAGRPGLSLSLQWGPWADSGMATRQGERDTQRWASYGITPIEPDAGMALLERLLAAPAAAALAVFAVDWNEYLGRLYGGAWPDKYRELAAAQAPAQPRAATAALTERLLAAPAAQRRELLEQALQDTVVAVLGLPPGSVIGARQRLFDMGLDSLAAVELRNRLALQLGRDLRSTLLFDFPTLQSLAGHIESTVPGLAEPVAAASAPAPAGAADIPHDQLSDEELARLLAAELG